MHAFDVLGDPVRRLVLEQLAIGERTAGELTVVVQSSFPISQPAVSQHLRVLRDAGFVTVRADGQRRIYTLDPLPLREARGWLDQFGAFWEQRLDALDTEIRRGRASSR